MSIEQGRKGLSHTETPIQLPPSQEAEESIVIETPIAKPRSKARQIFDKIKLPLAVATTLGAIYASPYIPRAGGEQRLTEEGLPDDNPGLIVPTESTVFDATATRTPRPTRTEAPTATETPEATRTPRPTRTETPSPTATIELTATSEATATPEPTLEPTTVPNVEYTQEQLDAIVESAQRIYRMGAGPDSPNPEPIPLHETLHYPAEFISKVSEVVYEMQFVDLEGIVIDIIENDTITINNTSIGVNTFRMLFKNIRGESAVINVPALSNRVSIDILDGQTRSGNYQYGPSSDDELFSLFYSEEGVLLPTHVGISLAKFYPPQSREGLKPDDPSILITDERERSVENLANWIEGNEEFAPTDIDLVYQMRIPVSTKVPQE